MRPDTAKVSKHLGGWLIAISFFLLYRITANQNFSFDALTNAIACETNEPVRWFHPNHPLYPFIGVVWFRLERLLGYTGYAIYSLERLNALLMGAALGLLWKALWRDLGAWRAAAVTVFLGVTAAVWQYAVDGRAVGASVFFSVAVIYALLQLRDQSKIGLQQVVRLAVLSSLLILMHGIALFHVLPVAAWFWWHRQDRKSAVLYSVYVGALLLAVYAGLYVFVARPFTDASFIAWCLGYAGFDGSGGALQSLFWLKHVSQILQGIALGWNRAILAVAPESWGGAASAAAGAVVFLGFLVSFSQIKRLSGENRAMVMVLITWGVLVGIFISFWSPGQEGFRLHVLVPWTVAAALCVAGSNAAGRIFALVAAVLFVVNFNYTLYPASFISNNKSYQALVEISSRLKPGDLVLSARDGGIPGLEVLRPYFFPEIFGGTVEGRLFAFREKSLDPLLERLLVVDAQGRSVYFSDDLFDAEVQKRIEADRGLRPGEMAEFAGKFKPQEFFVLSNGRQVYRVLPKTKR